MLPEEQKIAFPLFSGCYIIMPCVLPADDIKQIFMMHFACRDENRESVRKLLRRAW
jgi:hypothetical protein